MASFQLIIIAVLVLGIGFLAVFIIKSIAVPKRVEGIQKLIKQGKYIQAIKLGKTILAKEPHNYMAHYYMGKAYLADSRNELALMEYKIVNQTAIFDTNLPEVSFRKELASLYNKFKQPNEALKEYLLLTKQDAKNADNFYNCGLIYDQQGHPEVALGFYQKAIVLNKKHTKAHAALGLVLFHMKQMNEAKREIDLAIQLSPQTYSNYYYLGKILKGNKQYAEACKAFEKAFRDQEYRLKSILERGTCYMMGNSLDNAIADFDRAINSSKDQTVREVLFARYFLAACYEKQHKIEKSIDQWKAITAVNKNFRDVPAKLKEYEDLQANDGMKDYLTSAGAEFKDLCKQVVETGLGLSAQQIDYKNEYCQITAIEKGSDDWRNVRKQLILIWFRRDANPMEDSTVRQLQDKMKELNCTKGVLCSSSGFTRPALKFAENRPLELIGKEKLELVLSKAGV
ncbi:MAG: tetratricopeptide repeat protein [Treponema sp.]|nr:tetratricopeptide repeat protein [Treponema sp.]